jgi:hypothetical protein
MNAIKFKLQKRIVMVSIVFNQAHERPEQESAKAGRLNLPRPGPAKSLPSK